MVQSDSIHTLLDTAVTRGFKETCDQGGKIMAEYVWNGGDTNGWDMRCKTRTLEKMPESVEDLPIWNYDGSSTNQAPGTDSEVFIKPQAIFRDPFRGGNNILVLCDTYIPPEAGKVEPDALKAEEVQKAGITERQLVDTMMTPHPTNRRYKANAIMDKAKEQKPWFGVEQEYTLLDAATKWPLGWPTGHFPGPQGPYYCAAGAGIAIGRDIVESHYKACLHAGIKVSGVNAEVMPSQWEYQVGPCEGIESGDHLWMSRYIMMRVCEMYHVECSFHPKPLRGDWNGAGCHVNYSNEDTRRKGTGFDAMKKQIAKLEAKHQEHIEAYGEDNHLRLTGLHETASIDQFSWGVANRGSSIRVPRMVPHIGSGYYEDRRPASNMCPYVVTGKIVETTLL